MFTLVHPLMNPLEVKFIILNMNSKISCFYYDIKIIQSLIFFLL